MAGALFLLPFYHFYPGSLIRDENLNTARQDVYNVKTLEQSISYLLTRTRHGQILREGG